MAINSTIAAAIKAAAAKAKAVPVPSKPAPLFSLPDTGDATTEEIWGKGDAEAGKKAMENFSGQVQDYNDERAKEADYEKRFGTDMAWLDPEFKQDVALLGDSARSKVYADPNLVADQQRALDSLFGIAENGGATAQERARRSAARADSEDWLRGQREADMTDLRERGMSGSGAELLALGKDRQDAAGRLSKADLDTDAWLEQRALDALQSGGQLAGQMRDTGFREGQTRADAADEFSKLNADSLNAAAKGDAEFKRNAVIDRLHAKDNWALNKLNLGVSTAGGLMGSDVHQGDVGYTIGKDLAEHDAGSFNDARGQYNGIIGTPNPAANYYRDKGQTAGLNGDSAGYDFLGSTTDRVVSAAAGGYGGGGAGAAAGASGGFGGGSSFNYGGIASGVSTSTNPDDEKKAGSYA